MIRNLSLSIVLVLSMCINASAWTTAVVSGDSISAADTSAPTFDSASIAANGTDTTINFNENVTGTENDTFNLDCDGASGADVSLTYSSGSGTSALVFTAGATIQSTETCNLDFIGSANDFEDDANNDLADFDSEVVTNNSGQGGFGITYVASSGVGVAAESTSIDLVLGASTDSGDLVIVGMTATGRTLPEVGAGTFEDDRGNTWTRDAEFPEADSTDMNIGIYSCIAKDTGIITVTATIGGSNYLRGVAAAFSGVTNNTLDDSAQAKASSTDVQAGDITPTGEAVIFGFMRNISGASTVAPDGNWTEIAENESNSNVMSGAYRIVTSGTYNDGWTLGTSGWWRGATVCYK